jgi:hypothetical protein
MSQIRYNQERRVYKCKTFGTTHAYLPPDILEEVIESATKEACSYAYSL